MPFHFSTCPHYVSSLFSYICSEGRFNDIISDEVIMMPFYGVGTRTITEELKTSLIGGRINKIYQPTNTEIVMTVRNNRKNHALLLSIHPSYSRIHLTNDTYQYPNEPPTFCMVLRKYLASDIIEEIKQYNLERMFVYHVRVINEIGVIVIYTILL